MIKINSMVPHFLSIIKEKYDINIIHFSTDCVYDGDRDANILLNEDYYELLLKNIYTRLNLKSINEFDIYLKDYDLKIEDIKTKITIDVLWNELVVKNEL